jgi:hypothetical protein
MAWDAIFYGRRSCNRAELGRGRARTADDFGRNSVAGVLLPAAGPGQSRQAIRILGEADFMGMCHARGEGPLWKGMLRGRVMQRRPVARGFSSNFELIVQRLRWQHMLVDEEIPNHVWMDVKCFGTGSDVVWFRIIEVNKFPHASKRAEETLRKSALEFLAVGLRRADRAKRRFICPDSVAKQSRHFETNCIRPCRDESDLLL